MSSRPSWPRSRTRSGRRYASSGASGRDEDGGWVAVEVKRIGTIEAVEQLGRYLERIRLDPVRAECRGILAAPRIRPQALTLAEARGIRCAEIDLDVLRGEREPELTLFAPSAS